MIVNMMEEMVALRIDAVLGKADICKCDQCRNDVMALSLNQLPPRYVSRVSGNVFTSFSLNTDQGQAQVLTSLMRAVETVRANPRHVVAKTESTV